MPGQIRAIASQQSDQAQTPKHLKSDTDLTEIETLDRRKCLAAWQEAIGAAAPPRLSIEFMRMALAYELQCTQAGPQEQRSIENSRTELAAALGSKRSNKSQDLFSGAELVREWNGRTHRVRVVEDGYEYGGETYASLSAIAREITGTRWSGPRFFGVKG